MFTRLHDGIDQSGKIGVGLCLGSSPLRFALVGVIGIPNCLTSFTAKCATGQRTPIVWVPADIFNGTDFAAGKMTVSGPGQKCFAKS